MRLFKTFPEFPDMRTYYLKEDYIPEMHVAFPEQKLTRAERRKQNKKPKQKKNVSNNFNNFLEKYRYEFID